MVIGALLIVAWLILLIRYPLRALPISLGALLGLGLVALWVIWQEQHEARLLGQLELNLVYAPDACPAARPLQVTLDNHSPEPLRSLRWNVAARSPGSSLNLVASNYDASQYSGPCDLQPVERWQSFLPFPTLLAGYCGRMLGLRVVRLTGQVAHRG